MVLSRASVLLLHLSVVKITGTDKTTLERA